MKYYEEFKSEVFHALEKIVDKYKDVTEDDLEMAVEWFELFYDGEFKSVSESKITKLKSKGVNNVDEDYHKQFIKQNDEPIPIEEVEDEHYEELDFEPSFWWNNHRYYLKDFIKYHNNPWVSDFGIPDYIHAVEADNYYHSLYIELIGDEYVNIY